MRYLVIIESGQQGFSAYLPDLPGCVAVGQTREEVRNLIREAVDLHLEDMRERGKQVPEPSSESEYFETAV